MASLTNPFDAMGFESTTTTTNPPKDDFDLMAAFGGGSTTTTTKKNKPSAIQTSTLTSESSSNNSPKSSRSERRKRMARKGSRGSIGSVGSVGSVDSFQSTSSPDAFEEEEEDTNNIKTPAAALRRGSVGKMEPGLTGLRMSFKTEENQSAEDFAHNQDGAAPPSNKDTDPSKRPKNVLCPNCGMGNQVPDGKTFFNCSSCSLEMVAKLSDVPKTSRLQCPNCSRSIVAPPNCEMFKCICGQTMVVPGSDMAKKIQQQGTRKGESIFVQDKSDLYGVVHLRVTSKKIFKKWSTRFFSIQRGRILLFRSKLKAAQGSAALVIVGLHPRQNVSHVTDTTNKDIEHLHMITMRENVTESGGSPSNSGRSGFAFSEAEKSKIACELAFDTVQSAGKEREGDGTVRIVVVVVFGFMYLCLFCFDLGICSNIFLFCFYLFFFFFFFCFLQKNNYVQNWKILFIICNKKWYVIVDKQD